MAKYTIELRKVCEYYTREEVENWFKNYEVSEYLTSEQIALIEKHGVWNKDRLARDIVDHYYMREIGFETPGLFKHYAMVTMREIMGRQLLNIYSTFLEYDPLSNVDYTETYTREITGESEGTSNSSSENNANGLNINNNTPQKRITKQDIDTGAYASNVNQSETESTIENETTTNTSSTTTETYTHHMEGDNGVIVTNQYLVREFRELVQNFNEQIINELNILFMGLY